MSALQWLRRHRALRGERGLTSGFGGGEASLVWPRRGSGSETWAMKESRGESRAIDMICLRWHIPLVAWEVEYCNEFELWWNELGQAEHVQLTAAVELLMERGPNLPFPHSSGIGSSRHGHMRELRVQIGGAPYRIF